MMAAVVVVVVPVGAVVGVVEVVPDGVDVVVVTAGGAVVEGDDTWALAGGPVITDITTARSPATATNGRSRPRAAPLPRRARLMPEAARRMS
jgi:hypothetical protein